MSTVRSSRQASCTQSGWRGSHQLQGISTVRVPDSTMTVCGWTLPGMKASQGSRWFMIQTRMPRKIVAASISETIVRREIMSG
jgi:hypothetical protein